MNAETRQPGLFPRPPVQWRGVIVLIATALVAATVMSGLQRLTYERIEQQRQAAIVAQLRQVVPGLSFDNALVDERRPLQAGGFFQTDQALWWYPLRQGNQLQGVILDVVTPAGYNGDIRLLIGIRLDATTGNAQVSGVRVTQHLETPGLGDAVDYQKSHWVDQFIGQSLSPSSAAGDNNFWRVKRQGGGFDAISGATVTSTAMIAVVERSLRYVQQQGLDAWRHPPAEQGEPTQ